MVPLRHQPPCVLHYVLLAVQGCQDTASLCFHRAAATAERGITTRAAVLSQLPPQQAARAASVIAELQTLLQTASDNARLASSAVLPRDWLAALNDVQLQVRVWGGVHASWVLGCRAWGLARVHVPPWQNG